MLPEQPESRRDWPKRYALNFRDLAARGRELLPVLVAILVMERPLALFQEALLDLALEEHLGLDLLKLPLLNVNLLMEVDDLHAEGPFLDLFLDGLGIYFLFFESVFLLLHFK